MYPSSPLQPGPIYFLTPHKAALIGVCSETIPRQVNFVIDEACEVGKGANAVITKLDYFFNYHGLGETTVTFRADNCTGQNKNSTMKQYLMWQVLTGLHWLLWCVEEDLCRSVVNCNSIQKLQRSNNVS